jgi:hypothetical protein
MDEAENLESMRMKSDVVLILLTVVLCQEAVKGFMAFDWLIHLFI